MHVLYVVDKQSYKEYMFTVLNMQLHIQICTEQYPEIYNVTKVRVRK